MMFPRLWEKSLSEEWSLDSQWRQDQELMNGRIDPSMCILAKVDSKDQK